MLEVGLVHLPGEDRSNQAFMILIENNDSASALLGQNTGPSSFWGQSTKSRNHFFCSSWQKYGIYFSLHQCPTSSHPHGEKGQDCEIQPFTELIWCSFQSLITLEYKRVKLKTLYVHCEATLNPMLDVLLGKRDRWQELKQNTKKSNFLCTTC